ncbi:sec-independent protein translocase protein TatB [Lentzea pudingi]|uniref:Sec-independent protein translocase protein TatB n=1 Tax=Lentzea pudingi TaxID=1789439 RepID=A0ABQ2ILG9_9PSEU|nr:Sec-independent protein translocase protein TatB [Lentzea pudingi]GGN12390.1 sec-independent protein translocase protein TatB [Lentzea pudingi]
MFDSIGWVEILIIVVAGLFILGPERLPSAAAWLGKTVRQVREYATGAREQLKQEMGPEFESLRKPLEDLRELRNFDPKRAVTKHFFDDQEPTTKSNGYPTPSTPPAAEQRPLSPGERPPYDPDAT